ncbi:MAG: hypothetical protein FWC19_02570 [Treponema sp.]|nr:hypothetical protein [Treponema sp.]
MKDRKTFLIFLICIFSLGLIVSCDNSEDQIFIVEGDDSANTTGNKKGIIVFSNNSSYNEDAIVTVDLVRFFSFDGSDSETIIITCKVTAGKTITYKEIPLNYTYFIKVTDSTGKKYNSGKGKAAQGNVYRFSYDGGYISSPWWWN